VTNLILPSGPCSQTSTTRYKVVKPWHPPQQSPPLHAHYIRYRVSGMWLTCVTKHPQPLMRHPPSTWQCACASTNPITMSSAGPLARVKTWVRCTTLAAEDSEPATGLTAISMASCLYRTASATRSPLLICFRAKAAAERKLSTVVSTRGSIRAVPTWPPPLGVTICILTTAKVGGDRIAPRVP